MMDATPVFLVSAAVLAVLIGITVIRIIIGPNAPNRVVALDSINTIVVATMICLSAAFKTIIYIDIAIVYALLSFVSTLYIANYIGGGR